MASVFVDKIMETVVNRNTTEPEFHQAVKEVAESVEPVIQKKPEFAETKISEPMPREPVSALDNSYKLLTSETEAGDNNKIRLYEIIDKAKKWMPGFRSWMGREMPDFTLKDINGAKHKLSDYSGKNVMIIFWATWCGPCTSEIPGLIRLRKSIGQDKLAMLAISNENPRTVKRFVDANKVNYTVFSVPSQFMPIPYNMVNNIPTAFFIKPDGKLKVATVGLVSPDETRAILESTDKEP